MSEDASQTTEAEQSKDGQLRTLQRQWRGKPVFPCMRRALSASAMCQWKSAASAAVTAALAGLSAFLPVGRKTESPAHENAIKSPADISTGI